MEWGKFGHFFILIIFAPESVSLNQYFELFKVPEKFREKVFRNSTIQNADSLGNSLNLLKPVNQHLSLKARRSNDSGTFY